MSREALAAGLDARVLAAGPDPAVDVRLRPVRSRAAPPRDRARRARPRPERGARPRLTAPHRRRAGGRAMLRRCASFHVQRAARERYAIESSLFGVRGDLVVTRHRRDPPAGGADERRPGARRARRLGPGRSARSACSTRSAISSIARYDARACARGRWTRRWTASRTRLGPGRRTTCSTGSREEFPRPTATTVEPPPVRLEELLLIRVANENPAVGPLRELIDDRAARARDALPRRDQPASRPSFADGPPIGAGRRLAHRAAADAGAPGADLAGRPAPLHPRAAGRGLLGDALDGPHRAGWTSTLGILAEEERALHLRFGGGGGRRQRDRGAVVRARRARSPRRSRRTRPGCRGSC